MSKTEYNIPMPNADRSAPYPVQMTPVVTHMVAFLRSRAKTVMLPLDARSPKSPLEFAEKQANSTFTRAQVRTLAGKVIMQMKNNGPVSVKDRIPTYATGPKATDANLAKMLELAYIVNEGKDKERTTLAALHVIAQSRRNYARKVKADRLAAKVASGDAFFANNEAVVAHLGESERDRVTGVLMSKDGTPRAFASMKKASKAVARCVYGSNWFDVAKKVKGARLDECEEFCYEQGASVGQPDQHAVTGFFTVAVLESTHHATVRRLAREAGAPASATKSKALAIQWLSDDVSRMAGLTL